MSRRPASMSVGSAADAAPTLRRSEWAGPRRRELDPGIQDAHRIEGLLHASEERHDLGAVDRSSARARSRPSPCSPLRVPPSATTASVTSSKIPTTLLLPARSGSHRGADSREYSRRRHGRRSPARSVCRARRPRTALDVARQWRRPGRSRPRSPAASGGLSPRPRQHRTRGVADVPRAAPGAVSGSLPSRISSGARCQHSRLAEPPVRRRGSSPSSSTIRRPLRLPRPFLPPHEAEKARIEVFHRRGIDLGERGTSAPSDVGIAERGADAGIERRESAPGATRRPVMNPSVPSAPDDEIDQVTGCEPASRA